MKKHIYILAFSLLGFCVFAEPEFNSPNSIAGEVFEGENSIYPFLLITSQGNTNQDGRYLFFVQAEYSPLRYTNEFNELTFDDVSPPINVVFRQYVHVTNGVQTLGEILYPQPPCGTGWMGSPLSHEVELELMTTGTTLSICYDSDGVPGQTNGFRTVFGWVWSTIERP